MPQHKLGNLSIDYTVEYRPIRYPRIELKTGKPLLVLPLGYSDEKGLIEKHKHWLTAKSAQIGLALKTAPKRDIDTERSVGRLKAIILVDIENLERGDTAPMFTTQFKEMNSKWASCGSNNCLTFNLLLRFLPEELIHYVVFHEYTHLTERNHNAAFWKNIEKRYPEHAKLEQKLTEYWFLIMARK